MNTFQLCKYFVRRLVAHLLDIILMFVLANCFYHFMIEIYNTEFVLRMWLGYSPAEVFVNTAVLTACLLLATNSLYYTLLESSARQATLGKQLVGLIAVDEQGRRLSFARANVRYWSKWLSFLCVFLGFALALCTRKNQSLHDLMAHTLIIDKFRQPKTASKEN